MTNKRKLALSFSIALIICVILFGYAKISGDHPILPIKVIVVPALLVGALLSGNVHQPSAIGVWVSFLMYAWGLSYVMLVVVLRLFGPKRRGGH